MHFAVHERRPPPPGRARADCGRPGGLIRQDRQWLFAGRRLMVDWTETRLFLALALVLLLSIPWALAVSRRLANRAEPSTH